MTAETQKTCGSDDLAESVFRLPARFEARLDADGVVRGKTWRSFLYGSNCTLAALSWWLWKHDCKADLEFDSEGEGLA